MRCLANGGPFGYAHGRLLALGLHEDLDEALRRSVDYSVSLLSSLFHLPAKVIYLYLSAAADFDVSRCRSSARGAFADSSLAF